jgi:16S rRNA (guanine527-N7)-methyltransferase
MTVQGAPIAAATIARLHELGARFGLTTRAVEQLRVLLELLAGDSLAPTSIDDPARVLDDHLADSLVALELDTVQAAAAIADLGAGGGLPGIPLAIALPAAEVALVESNARKCAFLERAVDACGISNVRVVNTRAESWAEGIGRCDLVTARALAPLPVVMEYAAPLLRVGGALIAWRGRRDESAEAAAELAAQTLGLRISEPVRVKPYPAAQHRHLHVVVKAAETPRGFPRRPGIARKRPLGSPPASRDPSDRPHR